MYTFQKFTFYLSAWMLRNKRTVCVANVIILGAALSAFMHNSTEMSEMRSTVCK